MILSAMLKASKPLKRHEALKDPTLLRLEQDKLIQHTAGGPKTSARWQAAVMRATGELMQNPEYAQPTSQDLRIAYAKALFSIYGDTVTDLELTEMLLVLWRIEMDSLSPVQHSQS